VRPLVSEEVIRVSDISPYRPLKHALSIPHANGWNLFAALSSSCVSEACLISLYHPLWFGDFWVPVYPVHFNMTRLKVCCCRVFNSTCAVVAAMLGVPLFQSHHHSSLQCVPFPLVSLNPKMVRVQLSRTPHVSIIRYHVAMSLFISGERIRVLFGHLWTKRSVSAHAQHVSYAS
jgi:hypothetical protein